MLLADEDEDQILQEGPLEITIEPLMTVKDLKLKAFEDYSIPMELQRWLINDQYLLDDNILHDCGVTDESISCLNLFINKQSKKDQQIEINLKLSITSETEFDNKISETKQTDCENNTNNIKINNNEDDLLNGAAALPVSNIGIELQEIIEEENTILKCPICTSLNPPLGLACSACSQKKPVSVEEQSSISEELKSIQNDENGNLNQSINNIDEDDLSNEAAALPVPHIINAKLQEIIQEENTIWKCTVCTLLNPPLALACSACFQEKPLSVEEQSSISEELKSILNDEYGNFNVSDINNIIEEIIQPTVMPTTKPTKSSFCHLEILYLDTIDVVRNSEPFDCPICYTNVKIDEGCILRDCLHTFCRDCLASTIQYSEDAEVKCPFANGDYSCESFLQDCEIRALITKEIYEKHLAKSVRYAENQIKNSFHCKTPNCQGWAICEETVYQFECPVCELMNCLICQVIHNGQSCYEYQDSLNRNGQIKLETEQTDKMINQIVHTGQGMNCPTCQVIIMKISGCDWLKCSMCKTEVCWATRKPRRGPNGCQCLVNGVKCHPNCQNCH